MNRCSICGSENIVGLLATDLLDCHHEVNIYESRCKKHLHKCD